MKRLFNAIKLLIIAAAVYFLTGCAGNSDDEVSKLATAMAVGSHSNADKMPVNSSTATEVMYQTCLSYGEITFIAIDGSPQVVYSTTIPDPGIDGLSAEKKDELAQEYVAQLQTVFNGITADTAEVNTLKAIQLGAQSLQSADSDTTDKILLIMDSGLSTEGYLCFQDGLLRADTEDIVEALSEAQAIPDLDGVDVRWAFCGETAYPQEPLSTAQKEKLREIWNEILVKAGAESVEFTNDFTTGIRVENCPGVSTVDADEEDIIVDISPAPEPIRIAVEPIQTVILDNASVQFVGDQAVFLDETRAREEIRAVADQLLAHPDNRVYVIGTTASGDHDFCIRLSEARAQAVANVLMEFGVPEDQLIPRGLGCEDPWHIDDHDANGAWIEENAVQNRKVLIIDVDNTEDTSLL